MRAGCASTLLSRSVSDADVAQITATINKQIEQKLSIQTASITEEAQEIRGLRAVFGEAYRARAACGSRRLPRGVDADPQSGEWENFSVELCGGTPFCKREILTSLQ